MADPLPPTDPHDEARPATPAADPFVPPPVPPKQRTTKGYSMREGAASAVKLVVGLAVALVVLFFCSGITTVQPNEVALVLRCGRLVGQTPADQIRQPGLLLAWPVPIDEIVRVPVKQEREVTIRALQPRTGLAGAGPRGYALSGDQNLLESDLTLKYRISDPIAYALRSDQPERLLRDAV
ncbi:MAG: SPFH domain-containing protein, partial [Planctomycetota bacterium]